jgi:hypothetical protein
MLDFDEMRRIYHQTQIVRKPTYGIISGYHELPYVCMGTDDDGFTTRVRGKIHVSPRFLLRPKHLDPSYGEIFGEDEVDGQLAGRVFGFLGFRDKPVECTSESLTVDHVSASVDRVLSGVLDDIERMEDITMGVVITPNPRYFPVSIERFIASILEDEFRA